VTHVVQDKVTSATQTRTFIFSRFSHSPLTDPPATQEPFLMLFSLKQCALQGPRMSCSETVSFTHTIPLWSIPSHLSWGPSLSLYFRRSSFRPHPSSSPPVQHQRELVMHIRTGQPFSQEFGVEFLYFLPSGNGEPENQYAPSVAPPHKHQMCVTLGTAVLWHDWEGYSRCHRLLLLPHEGLNCRDNV
jgi:hypothetical protein